MRVNYTTYDVRRDQDSLNPRTHSDVMVLSQEETHPYWYARILGVFHARVLHTGSRAVNRSLQHIEFLWVRWFGTEPHYKAGFHVARLPMIGFIPDTDPQAFGFLDPSYVIRGCHIIPDFKNGRTSTLLRTTKTAGRPLGEVDDWTNFYVNVSVLPIMIDAINMKHTHPALWTGTCSCATLVVGSVMSNVRKTIWIGWMLTTMKKMKEIRDA
jgi:hypothetical protein